MNNKHWPIEGKKSEIIINDKKYGLSIFPLQPEGANRYLQFIFNLDGNKKIVDIGISNTLISTWKLMNDKVIEDIIIKLGQRKIRNWIASGEEIQDSKKFGFMSDNSPNTVEETLKILDEEYNREIEDQKRIGFKL
jgi:predicted ATP-grasp superfamily ATP-dependent carboligase